jgi:4'-phosphopantetheinyl transferase EntD
MQSADLDTLLKDARRRMGGVSLEGGFIGDLQGALMPGEAAFVANAVEKRRREFIAGRTAARTALRGAGGADSPILSGETREPLWPAGFVGSITHSDAVAFAVCVRSDAGLFVGIDVELHARLRRDLWRMVFGEAERAAFMASPEPDFHAAAAFSAKEAFEKAQFAASGRVMEFAAMRVDVGADGRLSITHAAGAGFESVASEAAGFWLRADDHVFTFVALKAKNFIRR